MDFFATRKAAQAAPDNAINTEDFAKAIQQRFGPGPSSILTNFDPSVLPSPKRKTPAPAPSSGGSTAAQDPPEHFQSVNPADLESMDAFIVDIRPHTAYSSARIPNALSLSVPSTLLKRPLFSLDQLAAMLPSSSARQRFSKWREAKRIVVYDADTSGVVPGGTLPDGSNILGLLRKFANDEQGRRFEGQLYWLKGGFQRVWRERRDLVDTRPPALDEEDDENNNTIVIKNSAGGSIGGIIGAGAGATLTTGALRPSSLLPLAFASSSTMLQAHRTLPTPSLHGRRVSSRPSLSMSMGYHHPPSMAANPFFDAIRQNTELLQGITECIPLRLPKRVRRRIEELPFQWLKDVGRRGGATNDPSSTSDDSQASDYESEDSDSNECSKTEVGAKQQSDTVGVDDGEDDEEVSLLSKARTATIVPRSKSSPTSFNLPNAMTSPGSLSPQSSGSGRITCISSLSPNLQSASSSSPGGSSDSLTDPDPVLVDEGMENLAMQFYRIELAEQRRLMGIMQHHSRESEIENRRALTQTQGWEGEKESEPFQSMNEGNDKGKSREPVQSSGDVRMDVDNDATQDSEPKTVVESSRRRTMSSPSVPFPYSITAGVEKGAKNRYRHIWPFEHARVRLHQRRPDEVTSGSDHDSSKPLPTPSSTTSTFIPVKPLASPIGSRPGTAPPSGFPNVTSNVLQPFLSASLEHSTPRYPGMKFGGIATPSGPLTGPMFGPGRSPSPPKPSSASATGGSATGFALSLPMKRNRTSSPGGMPPPPPKPSMSLGLPGGVGGCSLPPSFTRYRNANTGSGGSGESTATESEWESGTDKAQGGVPGSSRKKDNSAERKRKEEAARQCIKEPYDDYVNASYVQPLCTSRRYIATQGPLEATFVDFWTLVYQQNVHVIVMLTREVEGSMVKCGAYWTDEWYGPLQLKLISIEGKIEDEQEPRVDGGDKGPESGGFYFPIMPDPELEGQKPKSKKKLKKVTIKDKKASLKKERGSSKSKSSTTRSNIRTSSRDDHLHSNLPIIKRTFELCHAGYPDIPPRRIVHFQYLDWPDMNVPDDPRGVLGFIKEVDKAVEEADIVEPMPDSVTSEGDADLNKSNSSTKPTGVRFFEVNHPRKHSRKPSGEEIDRRTGIAKHALGRENAPVLMHCSAGVGRTGGFIAIDAVLDGVRKEIRKVRRAEKEAEEKQEKARGAVESRAVVGDGMDVEMNEVSPSGSGSGSGSGDVDMADARIETVPIPTGHGGVVLHVAVHHEMVPNEGPNPHTERRSKSSGNDLQTPMPMQVDPVSSNTEVKELMRKKQREETDTTTRLWSQNVSDQTGNYGSASRVLQSIDFAEHGVGSGSVPLPPLSTSSSMVPTAMDSEISSPSASDDSFGFASGFDKRFSGKGLAPVGMTSHLTQKSMNGSATSLSTGSGNGKGKGHGRTSLSLAGHPKAPSALRDCTSSVPSGRPAEVSITVGEGANHESFAISPPTTSRSEASPAPWVLSEAEKRADSSPVPSLAVDVPPPSRSLSPALAEASLSSRASSIHTSTSGSNNGITDLRRKIVNRGLDSPPTVNVGSGVESGSGSGAASASIISGSPSGSRRRLGNGSGTGSGTGSRSRSMSTVDSSPLEAGVLPTTGTDNVDSKSLQGLSKKLDTLAATSKLKSTETQRAIFDYTEPRPLHRHDSPLALSTFKVPLWEVVQDMREQRMSLCQSLRQYVFVHAVVIEGALVILDEENEKDGIYRKRRSHKKSKNRRRKTSDEIMSDIPRSKVISTGTAGNKRQASPTELPQEDKKGGQLLHKKPSLKRKPNE